MFLINSWILRWSKSVIVLIGRVCNQNSKVQKFNMYIWACGDTDLVTTQPSACVCVSQRLCKRWLAINRSAGWRQSWSVFSLCWSFREQIPTLTRLSSAWQSASSSLPAIGRTSSYNRELRRVNPPLTTPHICLVPNQNRIWSPPSV